MRLRVLLARAVGQALQGREDAALDEEIRQHIALLTERYQRQGMSSADAERAARRQFGNVTLLKERQRILRGMLSVGELWRDMRFGMRMLTKKPGLFAAMVLTLALGIGANTSVFSIVDAVLLRPLPYAHPERLMEVRSAQSAGATQDGAVSYPDFFDWRAQSQSFEELVSYHSASLTLTGVERAQHLEGEVVSWNLLPLAGVKPALGAGFRPEDENSGSRVVMLSHALWASQFGSDPSIVGKTIELSGKAYTVRGVMPPTFRFPVDAPQNTFWTTLAVDNDGTPKASVANRGDHELAVMGRLKPGVTAAQADAEMKAIAAHLSQRYPDSNTRNDSVHVQSELTFLLGDTRTLLLVILGAVGLVLLIACGNVGNLLLVRSRERVREMAMRSALGADRSRLVRQLLVESMILSMLGGLAGCTFAFATTPVVLRLIGDSVPRAAEAGVNLPVLAFAFAVSLASGIVFGLVPALTSAQGDLLSPLKNGGRSDTGGQSRLGSFVIVGQVALGIVLTAGAGLLVTSYAHLAHSDKGFESDHLLTFMFETPDSRYKSTRPAFYRQYFEKVRALPGVKAAAGSVILPMTDNSVHISFENPEHPLPKGQLESARTDLVSPEYFRTMGIPLLAGRDFSDADTEKSLPVMIVSRGFVEKYLSGKDVIGRKLKPGAGNGGPPVWREIVGVVGDVRHGALSQDLDPAYYLAASQFPKFCCMFSVVRTVADPLSVETQAKLVVASMDSNIPVTDVRTMQNRIGLQLAQPRFAMVLLSVFAGLALILTLVGLYGIMAYSVATRRREIGVRLALGAPRKTVFRTVMNQAALLVIAGTGLGVVGALGSGSMLHAYLYGTEARDPIVLAVVCGLVAAMGLMAAYLPACRAMEVEPAVALRCE